MLGGLVCDICEKRISVMRIRADVGAPPEKRKQEPETVEINHDLCEPCLEAIDPRIVELHEWTQYTAYGGSGEVIISSDEEHAPKPKRSE